MRNKKTFYTLNSNRYTSKFRYENRRFIPFVCHNRISVYDKYRVKNKNVSKINVFSLLSTNEQYVLQLVHNKIGEIFVRSFFSFLRYASSILDSSHSKTLKIFDKNNIISSITRFPYPLRFFASILLILSIPWNAIKSLSEKHGASRGRTTREDRSERDSSREKHGPPQCRIDFTSGYIFLRPFERGLRGQCIFNCADYSEWLLTVECACIIPQRCGTVLFPFEFAFYGKNSNRLFSFFFFFYLLPSFSRPCPDFET